MAAEPALVKYADLRRRAVAAIRMDFRYVEAMAKHAGTLSDRQETKRQKTAESAKSVR